MFALRDVGAVQACCWQVGCTGHGMKAVPHTEDQCKAGADCEAREGVALHLFLAYASWRSVANVYACNGTPVQLSNPGGTTHLLLAILLFSRLIRALANSVCTPWPHVHYAGSHGLHVQRSTAHGLQ